MLPLLPIIPIIAAAASATLFVRHKLKNHAKNANFAKLLDFVKLWHIPVDEEGNFNPDALLESGYPLLFGLFSKPELLPPLLEYGANPNICNAHRIPAIIYAISMTTENTVEIVCTLLKYGANPNVMDPEGKPALFYAVKNADRELISLLIDHGADASAQDATGKTCLFYATNTECIARILRSVNGIINVQDIDSKSALFYANSPEVMQMLFFNGIDPNIQDNLGQTALFTASTPKQVKTLIEGGVDPNIRDNQGKSAIFYINENPALLALSQCNANIDVTIQDCDGHTALYYQTDENLILQFASFYFLNGHRELINDLNFEGRLPISYIKSPNKLRQMIKWGADINCRDSFGRHILFYLTDYIILDSGSNHNSVLSVLINSNCNPDIRDLNGELAPAAKILKKQALLNSLSKKHITLDRALNMHQYDHLKTFMELGVDPNSKFSEYQTVLTKAISLNDEKLIEILLTPGLDVNVPNSMGNTPLMLAIKRYCPESCELLLKAGATVTAECFKTARYLGHPQIIQLLWQYAPEFKGNYHDYMTLEMRKIYNESINSELNKVYNSEKLIFDPELDFGTIYTDYLSVNELSKAIQYHDTAAIIYMIHKNIEEKTLDSFLYQTDVINTAINVNAPDIVSVLCKYGILKSYQTSFYTNPLIVAINNNRLQCVEVLLHYLRPDDNCVSTNPRIMALLKQSVKK